MRFFLLIASLTVLFTCSNSHRIMVLNVEDGTGLNKGTKVMYKGQKVGEIKKIQLIDNNVIIDIFVTKELKLYKQTNFYVSSTDIIGTKTIEIENPNNGIEYYPQENDTIICGIKPSQAEKAIKEFHNLSKSLIDTLTNKLDQIKD